MRSPKWIRSGISMLAGFLSLAHGAGNPPDEVRAAFARLIEAPGHAFHASVQSGGREAPDIEITGSTDRRGWTVCTQTVYDRTFDFVFYRRKAVIRLTAGWKTLADLLAADEKSPQPEPRPQRKETLLMTSGKMPAVLGLELLDKLEPFRREGDGFQADVKPEAAREMFGGGAPGEPGPAGSAFVRVVLRDGFPSRMELHQRVGSGPQSAAFRTTLTFSEIGTAKVEPPPEARQRLATIPAPPPPPVVSSAASGPLSREEAMEVARAMQKRMEKVQLFLRVYAMAHELRAPAGKSANDAFRELFRIGLCEDESFFALPDARARSAPPPDGIVGGIEDGFSKALAPGECDLTLVRWPGDGRGMGPPERPMLRADIRASDGTILVVVTTIGGRSRILETRDGIARRPGPQGDGDMFASEAGVAAQDILKPEPQP